MEQTHLDGSVAFVDLPFIKVVFQHGSPHDHGINGCRVEDLLDVLIEKLHDFQSRSLHCSENETALRHLVLAKDALVNRRKARERQGLIGEPVAHMSD